MSWEPNISRALTDNAVVRRVTRQIKSWAGHPVLEHHKWHFLVFGVLILVAVPWGLRSEERALEAASVQALAEAGVPVGDISFNGRNATIAAPEASAAAIESALADVAGIRNVTVIDTTLPDYTNVVLLPPDTTPPATTTPPPPTTSSTTTTTLPPVPTFTIEVGHSVRLAGTLPDALTVAALSDIGEFMYGGLVINELLVDSSLPEPVWLESADDLLRAAAWLSQGSISVTGDRATVLGTAASGELAGEIVALLQAKLGADVPLSHDLDSIEDGTPAIFEIVGDEDVVEVRGTLPDARVLQRVRMSVEAIGEEAEVVDELALGENTASSYVTLRTPYMIRLLGTAMEFTYRYDGDGIRGSVVGGAVFDKGDNGVTRSMSLLVDAVSATMLADTNLTVAIEIHSDTADGDAANLELSRQRARAVLLELVRAGIDPVRVTIGPGDGAGELLRFHLTAAENK